VADLNSFVIPAGTFDVVINFNYLQRDLAPHIAAALKPGGVLIFETLTVDHLRHKPDFSPDYLLNRGELLRMFRGLHLIKYREAEIQARHSARAVASLLAMKNSLEKTPRNR
jgi:hypothetical protein